MASAVAILTPDDLPDETGETRCEVPADLAAHYRQMYEVAAKTIRSRIELVSPKQAEAYLERNDHNRPLSELFAKRYAEIMCSGEWRVNGQGIIRDTTGAILDGQHRLNGIIKAAVAVPLLIIEGVDAAVFQTIDQGRKRDFAGYLAMNGEKNTTTLASAVRWLLWFEAQKEDSGVTREMAYRPNITTLFAMLDLHPGIKDSVHAVFPHRKRKLIVAGPFTTLHYLTSRRHPGKVTASFWDHVLTGANVPAGSPAHILRQALEDNATAPKQYPTPSLLALIIKAFNATVQNKKVKCLKYAAAEESFPEIV